MGVHYFGKKMDGKLARFFGSFSDDEFEALIQENGLELPKGWKAWHFDDHENITNSKRVQAFAKLPEIKVLHWSGVYYSAPREKVAELFLAERSNS